MKGILGGSGERYGVGRPPDHVQKRLGIHGLAEVANGTCFLRGGAGLSGVVGSEKDDGYRIARGVEWDQGNDADHVLASVLQQARAGFVPVLQQES